MLHHDRAQACLKLECDEPSCQRQLVFSGGNPMADALQEAATTGWGIEYSGKSKGIGVYHYCPACAKGRDGVTPMSHHIRPGSPTRSAGSRDPSGMLAGIVTTAGQVVDSEDVQRARAARVRHSVTKPVSHLGEETLGEFQGKFAAVGRMFSMLDDEEE